ncbi:MAG: sulfatase-like hydrolase/transferase, partial [bacterium]|nr:sulfatase-like hydrolase/transferase [bacterium]
MAVAAERPNIVLMMADDLGWGDVGFHGNRVIRTPELDRMAAGGLEFERFYAGAPVCSPTRGSAISGRHPFRYGVYFANEGHMRAAELTLAELLRDAGYRTGHFGKWHLGTLTKTLKESNRGGPDGVADYAPPWENGFEVAFSSEAKTPTYDPMWKPKADAPSIGWDWIRDLADAEPYGTHYWREDGRVVKDNLRGDDSRVIMDRAVPFIERSAGQGRPFFAVIWFHSPHLPVVAGPEHAGMYKQYSSYERNYYGTITAMDEQVGRLRHTLRNAGVARDTMVWFCSDNGPEGQQGKAPGSAGPFRGRKRSLYEGGIRVPGLVEWPATVKPGGKTDFPAVTSDYLPTILEVVGAKL